MGTSMTAFLPEGLDCSKARVVYLLHGLADNCTGWSRYTSVERYARCHDIAVIIPEVQRSFYSDMELGLPYFSFVSNELPKICSNIFGLSQERSLNYIMGLSMGGYGSLKSVFNNPGRYEGCATFSAVTDLADSVATMHGRRAMEYEAMFGPGRTIPQDCDLFGMLGSIKESKTDSSEMPRFYMACGRQDELLSQNERFSTNLVEAGLDCVFETWDGMHNWDFWDEAVKRAFAYFFES